MENLFIPYEQALIIKELGFDEPCFRFKNNISNIVEEKGWLNWNEVEKFVSLPLYQQAFRWFREKKYQAEILWRGDFGDFCWKIGRFEQGSHFFSDDGFNTYEEAELECLKKLIEIVNK